MRDVNEEVTRPDIDGGRVCEKPAHVLGRTCEIDRLDPVP